MMLERFDEAYDVLFKSAWNAAWQDAAYLNLARIATRKGHVGRSAAAGRKKSLMRNYASHTARHLKAAILRKLRTARSSAYVYWRIADAGYVQPRLPV